LNNIDRNYLGKLSGQDLKNGIGKESYVKHHVIPEHASGKNYYIYCICVFIE